MNISQRAQTIAPSPTLELIAKALKLKQQGKNITNLSAGEPDFATPEHIKEAAIKAIKDNQSKYTPVDGSKALKEAIANKLSYDLKEILVSCGAKHSLYNLMQALLNKGDEVIIPAPYWVSYPAMVQLAAGTPVIITTDIKQHFKITPTQLATAITPKTRLFILNSPNNPSGAIYSKEELKALREVLLQHPNVVIASDEIYAAINFQSEPVSNIATACPELRKRTVIIDGVSKAYAMTGWRIGYAAGPRELISAMKKIQSQSTSCPNSIAQAAAIAAITGDQKPVHTMVKAYKKRHDYLYQQLKNIPGIKCLPSAGTFYAFPNIEDLLKELKIANDTIFAEYLLNEKGIVVVPGSAFGCPYHLRFSYAADMETIQEALSKLNFFLNQ